MGQYTEESEVLSEDVIDDLRLLWPGGPGKCMRGSRVPPLRPLSCSNEKFCIPTSRDAVVVRPVSGTVRLEVGRTECVSEISSFRLVVLFEKNPGV